MLTLEEGGRFYLFAESSFPSVILIKYNRWTYSVCMQEEIKQTHTDGGGEYFKS